MNKILRKHSFSNGVEVTLSEGDITLSGVEAITNPSNPHLAHSGGLAGILSRQAGPSMQMESSAWVREMGPVSHETPAHTGAGNLPFKAVIHAVGPVWGSGDEDRKLDAAVRGALRRAEDLKLQSLALPAISTGIFGFPIKRAARVILTAVMDYCGQVSLQSLRKVEIVIFESQSALIFQEFWDETLP